jgi:post-segregation antitoxin (ccd killing protein)
MSQRIIRPQDMAKLSDLVEEARQAAIDMSAEAEVEALRDALNEALSLLGLGVL